MRQPPQTDQPHLILQARIPHVVVIQVQDPTNVHFSFYRHELERLDAAGIPLGGFILNNTFPPTKFENFLGELWVRGEIAGQPDFEFSYAPT